MQAVIGVLALQGAFEPHEQHLAATGAVAQQVRTPDDLIGIQGLVLPGGESTTMSLLLASSGLDDALSERLTAGLPVLGTCAGMILLAASILDGRPDQHGFGIIDIDVRRNGYGRQLDSFEIDIDIEQPVDLLVDRPVDQLEPAGSGAADPFHAIFIRAPRVERCGAEVEVLARVAGDPVLVRAGSAMAASFHPELGEDTRVHRMFTRLVAEVS